MSLKQIQKQFTASVIGEADSAFISAVEGGGKLTSAQAVGVYRNGYPARMSEALGETFAACWRVIGDDDFLEACRGYCRWAPSKSHNLSDYGSAFPEYLLERFCDEAPFIGNLARLEWSFKNLFHAPSHAGLSPEKLAGAVKNDSVLVFGAAVIFLSFPHKVYDLWKRDRSDAAILKRSDWEGRQNILLYKDGGAAVYSRLLADAEAEAFRSLDAGRSIAEALDAAEGLNEAAARDLFLFISSAGLVTEVGSASTGGPSS